MIELPLVLVAGLLGSSHCVGMCGGFALTIGGSAGSVGSNLLRQLAFTAGRVFTYSTLGALAAFGGRKLLDSAPALATAPAILAIVAGLFLVWQGLAATGIFRRRATAASHGPCLMKGFFATMLTAPGYSGAFLAGVLTGFLPCGLVYGMLALAASTVHVGWGMAVMAVFGLGTAPIMILTGVGGSLLSLAARQRLLAAAAWCVVVTGAVSIARGAAFLTAEDPTDPAACPACHEGLPGP